MAGLARSELSKVSKLCFHHLVQETDRLYGSDNAEFCKS